MGPADTHRQPATAYAAENSVALDPARSAVMAGLRVGDVESAATSSRFLANVLTANKWRAGSKADLQQELP